MGLAVICLAGLAAAEKLTNGSNSLYDEVNSGGQTLQNSQYKLQDVKALPAGGKISNGTTTLTPGLLGLVTGAVITPEVPAGTTKLYISRSGANDIKITWDTTLYPGTKVYFLTGDGTGKYNYSYVAAPTPNWVTIEATTAGFTVNYTAGEILHLNQNGQGTSEAYYKGLVALGQSSLADYIPSAEAAGKINYSFYAGNNFFNFPFVSEQDVNGLFGATGYALNSQVLDYQRSTDGFTASNYNGTAWQDPFTMQLGKTYVFNSAGSAPVNISLLGHVKLYPAEFSHEVLVGNNYISLPFPVQKTIGQAFGTDPVLNDSFMEYNRATDGFVPVNCTSAGSFQFPDYPMKGPQGYVYARSSGTFVWQPLP